MIPLPTASLDRVLQRVDSIWGPDAAPHVLIYGSTGAGKSTLITRLLELCPGERSLLIEPKRNVDRIYNGPEDDPHRWGKPVTSICPRFGYDGEPGGGPGSMFYRLQGSPDRVDTSRRFAAALDIVANEGHTCLILG